MDRDVVVTVIGTSICDMVLGRPRRSGCLASPASPHDGILPGLYGYEAGQVAVGDMLAWFVRTLVPVPTPTVNWSARRRRLRQGETGLLALDWFNGNRSILPTRT